MAVWMLLMFTFTVLYESANLARLTTASTQHTNATRATNLNKSRLVHQKEKSSSSGPAPHICLDGSRGKNCSESQPCRKNETCHMYPPPEFGVCCPIGQRGMSGKLENASQPRSHHGTNTTKNWNATIMRHERQSPGSAETGSGTIISVTVGVVLLLLAIGFLGWLYYASTHPVSASGKWLLEHEPRYLWAKYRAKIAHTKFVDSASASSVQTLTEY